MLKTTARYEVAAQGIHDTIPFFYKPGIRMGIDPHGAQCHDDLGAGFCRSLIIGGEAAICILNTGQEIHRPVQGSMDTAVACVVGSQRCDRHSRQVRVGGLAHQGPAAVGKLVRKNRSNHLLPAHRQFIVMAVRRAQSPDHAVDALLFEIGQTVQALQQIVACHIGHILAHGGQGQDQAGIVRGLILVELALLVDIGLYIALHIRVVAVGYFSAAADQTNDQPFIVEAKAFPVGPFNIIFGGTVNRLIIPILRKNTKRQCPHEHCCC